MIDFPLHLISQPYTHKTAVAAVGYGGGGGYGQQGGGGG